MGLAYGIVAAAAQLGIEAILVRPKRAIGPFTAHVTISERHVDEMEIVDHPVEVGAQISDHAFKRPAEVTIICAWSDSPQQQGVLAGLAGAVSGTVAGVQAILTGSTPDQVRDVYARLLALQSAAIPFDVFTGKRHYTDMLVKTLIVETDKEREHTLYVEATLRQVIRVSVRVVNVSAPAEDQADPQATMPNVDRGIKQLSSSTNSFNLSSAVDSLTPTGLEDL